MRISFVSSAFVEVSPSYPAQLPACAIARVGRVVLHHEECSGTPSTLVARALPAHHATVVPLWIGSLSS